jgi:hypothetical protein
MELALEVFTPHRALLETTQRIIGEEMSQLLLASIKGRVMICVLDTNFLLNDIQNLIRRGSNTWLMDAAQTGIVRLFASTTVCDEVREKLNNPKITGKKLKIDPVVALQHWVTYYIPRITFLDPTGLPHLSPRVKALYSVDPDDVPTGQIIELIQPDCVLSRDHHLASFELISENWGQVVRDYRDASKSDELMIIIVVGENTVFRFSAATFHLSFSLIRKIEIDKKIVLALLFLLVGLAVAGGLALAHPVSRRWLQERSQSLVSSAKKGTEIVTDYLQGLAHDFAEVQQQGVKAKQNLTQHPQRAKEMPRNVRGYIAVALAGALGSLSATELVARMEKQGYQTSSTYPETYVRTVLHRHPLLFERDERKRWHLRSHIEEDDSPFEIGWCLSGQS